MTGQKRTRFNPVLLFPACLFGTRLLHGLIFRPHNHEDDKNAVGDVDEVVEVGEELVEMDDNEVTVAESELADAEKDATCKDGDDVVDDDDDVAVVADVVEEVSNKATWETLSLDSQDSNASSVFHAAAPPACPESCSRTVLMNDWLRGLKLCHPPRFGEKWAVEEANKARATPQQLERQMERAQCFINPMYHLSQAEEPVPVERTPEVALATLTTPTPRLFKPKRLISKPAGVEPFVLSSKHRSSSSAGAPKGGITSRSDGAYEVANKRQGRLKFKSSSTFSIAGTPRRLSTTPRCVTSSEARAWVRSNSGGGSIDYLSLMRPRDSVEDMHLNVRRLEVASTS